MLLLLLPLGLLPLCQRRKLTRILTSWARKQHFPRPEQRFRVLCPSKLRVHLTGSGLRLSGCGRCDLPEADKGRGTISEIPSVQMLGLLGTPELLFCSRCAGAGGECRECSFGTSLAGKMATPRVSRLFFGFIRLLASSAWVSQAASSDGLRRTRCSLISCKLHREARA